MTVADSEAEEKKKKIVGSFLTNNSATSFQGKSLFLALSWGAVQSQASLSPSA